jgi:hypothetical protein
MTWFHQSFSTVQEQSVVRTVIEWNHRFRLMQGCGSCNGWLSSISLNRMPLMITACKSSVGPLIFNYYSVTCSVHSQYLCFIASYHSAYCNAASYSQFVRGITRQIFGWMFMFKRVYSLRAVVTVYNVLSKMSSDEMSCSFRPFL